MIEFKINGQALNLPESTTIQLLRKNEIFAFDAMEVERSISFDIPATDTNNVILELANDYHSAGRKMRVKLPATMVIGVVTREGYLCINQYDNKNNAYKAIFLFGQLLGLQELRNAAKISEMGLQTSAYIDSQSTIYNAPDATDKLWAKVKYDAVDPHGSISVKLLAELINEQRPSLPRITMPQDVEGMRIVKAKNKGFEYEQSLTSTINPDAGTQPDETVPTNPYNLQNYDPLLFDVVEDAFAISQTFGGRVTTRYYKVQGLRVLTPLSIKFGNMSGKWYLQRGGITFGDPSEFYGGHWWEDGLNPNDPPREYGAGLANKTIDFVAGDKFYLVNLEDYTTTSILHGWNFRAGHTFPHNIEVTVSGDERIFLRDNLPDFAPIDLCKIVAAVTGTVIRYDEQRGVWFDDLQGEWERVDLNNVIERGVMERKFGDFAQRNRVRFEDQDNPETLEVVYYVDNENLTEEKDLQVIPLSSGVTRVRQYYSAISLAGDKDIFAGTIQGNDYLQRVTLKKNDEIQAFCDQSTSLQITCMQNILEYTQAYPRTLYYYDGALWSWVDMQWAGGKVQILLAKK